MNSSFRIKEPREMNLQRLHKVVDMKLVAADIIINREAVAVIQAAVI